MNGLNVNKELQRAVGRQQWLIEACNHHDPATEIKHKAPGPIEAVAQFSDSAQRVILRDMRGGPEGWTTVLLRDSVGGERVKAHLDDEHSVKAYVAFLYGSITQLKSLE